MRKELYSLFIDTFPEGYIRVEDGKVSERDAQRILKYKEKGCQIELVLMRHESAALNASGAAKEIALDAYIGGMR